MAKSAGQITADLKKLGKDAKSDFGESSLSGWGMLFMKKSLEELKDGESDIRKFKDLIGDTYNYAFDHTENQKLTKALRTILTRMEDLLPRLSNDKSTFTPRLREQIKEMGEMLRNIDEDVNKMLKPKNKSDDSKQ